MNEEPIHAISLGAGEMTNEPICPLCALPVADGQGFQYIAISTSMVTLHQSCGERVASTFPLTRPMEWSPLAHPMLFLSDMDVDNAIAALEAKRAKLVRIVELRMQVEKLVFDAIPNSKGVCGVKVIIAEVCRRMEVSVVDLLSSCRTEDVAVPRMVVYWLAWRLTSSSFATIGNVMGRQHKTTANSGCRRVQWLMDTDERFKAKCIKLEAVCKAQLKNLGLT